tara:strand:- start:151 stop:1113 length:963 start_codon:yes stop_codon:yes gene_type:complete
MKKLIIALSALGAAFTATAKADIAVSGSANVAYLATAGTGTNDEELAVGQTVVFAMSTTTASGMGISGGMTLSQDYDTNGSSTATGGQAVTFTTGGATIVVGDVEISDTTGSIGGVVNGPLDDASDLDTSVGTGFVDDDGMGVELTTAVGAASLNLSYVSNDGADNYGVVNSTTAGADSAMSASISLPMSGYTVTLGVADSDTGEQSSGATVSGAIGGGTVTVGYASVTTITGNADITTAGDSDIIGATFVMSLDADTTISVGMQNAKDADSESHTQTDLSVSRALGGGASVYLDVRSLTGDTAANADGTAIGFGTSVSF